jgi:hypothetical protein
LDIKVRSGTVNGQGRWKVWNVHTEQNELKLSQTFAKSRSRFKNKRITVLKRYNKSIKFFEVSKWIDPSINNHFTILYILRMLGSRGINDQKW